jgi:poly(hydroxyalkanoate) granule-associated protein
VATRAVRKTPQAEVVDSAQQFWTAGIGILALAQEEGGKLFETLVDAGKQIEKVMPSPSVALRDATANAESYLKKLQRMVDHQIAAALHRLGVPTKDEIDKLTRRIEKLTASIEALRIRS